jgi:2',3'-cyclic-nucleotide 2'-phosphodiesterase (5'-nucleotidase family)
MVPVTAMMMAVVTATIGIVTPVTATVVTTMTAMTPMVTVTTVTTVTMTGERRHRKQHGSRYRANKRELPKHELLRGLSLTTTLLALGLFRMAFL